MILNEFFVKYSVFMYVTMWLIEFSLSDSKGIMFI